MKKVLLLFALIVFSGAAFDFSADWLWHDQQRVQQIVLMVCVAGLVVARGHTVSLCGGFTRTTQLGWLMVFSLGLLSAVGALELKFSFLEWATFWLLLLFALLVAQSYRQDTNQVEKVGLVLLAAVAAAVASKILIGYAAAVVEGVRLDTLLLFEGAFSNRRFFGQLATLLIPLLAWAVLVNRRFAVAWFIVLAAWWMLVLVSGTRGSWVALGVAHFVLFVWAGRRAWPWMRVQFAAAGLGGVAYWLLFFLVPGWLGVEAGVENRLDNLSTLSAREVIWGLAWRNAMEHPWLGVGPMHFAAYPNPVAAHPHNAVLQLAAEWGFPAAIAALALVGYGLWAFMRPLRQEGDVLRLALAVSLVGALVQSMVDGMLVIPYTQTWLALIAGLALGVHFQRRTLPVPSPSLDWGVRGVTLFALAALLYGVLPDLFHRAEITAAYLETHDSLTPRFWAQGWIR